MHEPTLLSLLFASLMLKIISSIRSSSRSNMCIGDQGPAQTHQNRRCGQASSVLESGTR